MVTELKPTNLIAVGVEISEDETAGFCDVPNDINFKILGEVTKDKIGFDVKPYVEKLNNGYADYANGGNVLKEKVLNMQESFYSLLAANGLYLKFADEKYLILLKI